MDNIMDMPVLAKAPNVVNMMFGSHLYGLNTPDSDIDYRVYSYQLYPTLLGKINDPPCNSRRRIQERTDSSRWRWRSIQKLVMTADGALAQKLEAYKTVNHYYANAIAQQKWVPEVQMGGSGGEVSAANDLISMFMVKTAKDLSLDMKIK